MLAPTRGGPPLAGAVAYRGDLEPPTRSYAASYTDTAIGSTNTVPASTNRTGAAVVVRIPRRDGLAYHYGYGAVDTPKPQTYPGGNDGRVESSAFQTFVNHLFNWSSNDCWYAAGYPRNLGYTFRVAGVRTNPTGGSTKARMDVKPVWPKVQVIPRYSTVPPVYKTRSALS